MGGNPVLVEAPECGAEIWPWPPWLWNDNSSWWCFADSMWWNPVSPVTYFLFFIIFLFMFWLIDWFFYVFHLEKWSFKHSEVGLKLQKVWNPSKITGLHFWFPSVTNFVNVCRSRRHEVTIKKMSEVAETAPRSSLDSLDNDSSSSVRILQLKTCSSQSGLTFVWIHIRLFGPPFTAGSI